MSKPVVKTTEETPVSSSDRDVVEAKLHTTLFVRGIGQFGPTLSVADHKGGGVIKKLAMSWGPTTLDLVVNGSIKVGVPHANIQCVTFKD